LRARRSFESDALARHAGRVARGRRRPLAGRARAEADASACQGPPRMVGDGNARAAMRLCWRWLRRRTRPVSAGTLRGGRCSGDASGCQAWCRASSFSNGHTRFTQLLSSINFSDSKPPVVHFRFGLAGGTTTSAMGGEAMRLGTCAVHGCASSGHGISGNACRSHGQPENWKT
jgi:hypothetical protein